jgi:riboflavin kinase/FMN adenylyltransferase
LNLIPYNNFLQITEPSVITVGSFDGVHLGHQSLFRQVNEYAQKHDFQSVLVTFNPHPQEVLQTQSNFFLINSFEQKIALFEKFGIDTVFVIPFSKTFSQIPATEFFEEYIFSKINVKAVFMGPNHHFGKQREGDANTLTHICKEKNIEIITTNEFKVTDVNVRSTLIRQYLAQKDFQSAEKLMGHSVYTKK